MDNPEHIDILFPNKGEEMLHEWLSVRKIEVILRAKCEAGPRLVFHLSQRTFHPQLWSRTRFGDPSPVAFVESPENEVISERLLKKQQLRCRQCGREL